MFVLATDDGEQGNCGLLCEPAEGNIYKGSEHGIDEPIGALEKDEDLGGVFA